MERQRVREARRGQFLRGPFLRVRQPRRNNIDNIRSFVVVPINPSRLLDSCRRNKKEMIFDERFSHRVDRFEDGRCARLDSDTNSSSARTTSSKMAADRAFTKRAPYITRMNGSRSTFHPTQEMRQSLAQSCANPTLNKLSFHRSFSFFFASERPSVRLNESAGNIDARASTSRNRLGAATCPRPWAATCHTLGRVSCQRPLRRSSWASRRRGASIRRVRDAL